LELALQAASQQIPFSKLCCASKHYKLFEKLDAIALYATLNALTLWNSWGIILMGYFAL